MDNLMQISIKAREIADQLKHCDNMCEIGDIIDSLDEETAKWVLRILIYDKR